VYQASKFQKRKNPKCKPESKNKKIFGSKINYLFKKNLSLWCHKIIKEAKISSFGQKNMILMF
jgi:hypothetical protein